MATKETMTIETREGLLCGARHAGMLSFRGVPYAQPPTGPLRFAPPRPHPSWDGTRDALENGPIAPQGKSRLAHVMGDFDRPQSEDCLTLTIWTPQADGANRPVMVWLHGGAYMSGAGSLDWYDGHALAAHGDVVVVSVNYRLGALGFLRLDGVAEGNMGLLDQLEALRWVRRNIAAFGGDPEQVTVFGQSAGGASIAAMMAMPEANGLFRHAILQSPAMGRPTREASEASELGERYREFAGVAPLVGDGTELRLAMQALPVAKILDAQGQLARALHTPMFSSLPFMPVVDGKAIREPVKNTLKAGSASAVKMMIGTTREEMAAFFCNDPAIQQADDTMVHKLFETALGKHYEPHLADYRRLRTSTANAAVLGDLMSDTVFRMGSLQLALWQAALHQPAYVYQFDWQSPGGFEACHCLEIPFVFGNPQAWSEAPMVAGIEPSVRDGLTRAMQDAWIAFARTGDPNHDGLPRWDTYEKSRRTTMRFDRISGPIDDLAGIRTRLPWPGEPD